MRDASLVIDVAAINFTRVTAAKIWIVLIDAHASKVRRGRAFYASWMCTLWK